MKKMMKSVMCIALALSMVFCASGCQKWVEDKIGEALNNAIGDTFKEGPKMTYGDFVYCYVTSADSNRRAKSASNIAIIGLTKEGQQKETIVIPETIEGKPVILIGMSGLGRQDRLSEGAVYQKLYLNSNLQCVRDDIDFRFVKTFLLDNPNYVFWEYRENILRYAGKGSFTIFVIEELYNEYMNLDLKGIDTEMFDIANLTYIVNSEIYWIDDYEDGELIVPPQDPTKEGYVFDGWYMESECINKWNFETDVYTLDESLTTKKLYAKWIENES